MGEGCNKAIGRGYHNCMPLLPSEETEPVSGSACLISNARIIPAEVHASVCACARVCRWVYSAYNIESIFTTVCEYGVYVCVNGSDGGSKLYDIDSILTITQRTLTLVRLYVKTVESDTVVLS